MQSLPALLHGCMLASVVVHVAPGVLLLLQVCDHPNVVALHEVWEDASHIFIVMVSRRRGCARLRAAAMGGRRAGLALPCRLQPPGASRAEGVGSLQADSGLQPPAAPWTAVGLPPLGGRLPVPCFALHNCSCFCSTPRQEACLGGELFDVVIERKFFTEADAASITAAVLSVIQHCHGKGIIHRGARWHSAACSELATAEGGAKRATIFQLSSSTGRCSPACRPQARELPAAAPRGAVGEQPAGHRLWIGQVCARRGWHFPQVGTGRVGPVRRTHRGGASKLPRRRCFCARRNMLAPGPFPPPLHPPPTRRLCAAAVLGQHTMWPLRC